MTFKSFVPYNQLELDVITANDDCVEYFYPTLEELIEEHGPDCEYSIMEIDNVFLHLNDEYWLPFDDIGLN